MAGAGRSRGERQDAISSFGPSRLALLLRALWWRRGLSAATLLVAVITIGAGSLGPMFARAADESTLRDRLIESASDAALHFTFIRDLQTEGDLAAAASGGPQPGSIKAYPNTLVAAVLPVRASLPAQVAVGDVGPISQLVWRTDACAHLVLTRGRCPAKPGEALASERTLAGTYYGWQVGTRLTLSGIADASVSNAQLEQPGVAVTIVGAYRQRDANDAFWQGRSYFNARPGAGDGPDTVDGLFVDRSELPLLYPSRFEVQVDYPVAAEQVRLADVPALRADLAKLVELRSEPGVADSFSTDVLSVLKAAQAERRLIDLSTLLVSLQLTVLAWLVLFQVIADAVEAKGSEIALAKLRGLPPSATLRFGLAEPLLLVALATPLGLLGGWLSVRLLAATSLLPGTPVPVTRATWVAVAAALAGSVVAAAAAGRKTLRRSVLEQWRRTPGHHASPLMLVLDVLLALAAVLGLVLLHRTGRNGDPRAVTLLAPALLVFAVALLGIRLLPLVLRPLLPMTRASGRIGLFLAARQVVRRPAGLRLAALLAVAVGLATFAIAGEGVASSNAQTRARIEVGTDRVATVQFEPLHDPVAATHRADPDGRWAMAAATWLPDGGGAVTGRVLAVDAARLPAVAYSGGSAPDPVEAVRALRPANLPAPLEVHTTRLRVSIDTVRLGAGNRPLVVLNLRAPNRPAFDARAGTLTPGQHTYTAAVSCAAGCTLTGITWDRPIDTFGELSGTVRVSKLEFLAGGRWQQLDAGFAAAGNWRAQPSRLGNSDDVLSATAGGLQDDYRSQSGGSAGISHADSPRPMPVLASPRGLIPDAASQANLRMSDETGAVVPVAVAGSPAVLPGVLDDGVLIDITGLRQQLPAFDSEASWSIWLGPHAPADALDRLRAAGLVVEPGASYANRLDELGRQGPALALRLLVVCAIVGSILAVGGTAIAIASTGRRRTFELASLRAVGIRRRTLLGACISEQLLLLGAAVLLGVPAGYLAARWALPSVPEFADITPVSLSYRPALTGIALFALVFGLLLAGTAVLAGRALLRAAAPARLREAE
ncbi:FtsX-like permease family protein [Jatrophihabitans sp.]|uniref:FtsX-like permease family protein n=1 Tax=Jatrophihabitans sp. TaxID=1932789 RepID=UPI002CC9B1DA|nr:FtsX-like permease family protein [Jatrophihabitans sp.]